MFDFLKSKNEKLVGKWHDEHIQIVDIAHKVLAEHAKNNPEKAKEYLKKLNEMVVDHVMNEDVEFFKMLQDYEHVDYETEKLIKDFVSSFKKTKIELMDFLKHYSKPEVELDDDFAKQFMQIAEAVEERISFEEREVYSKLKRK